MTPLYLDTSTLVPLHVTEAGSAMLTAWFDERDDPLAVGDLAAGEFGATMSRLVRMDQLSPEGAEEILRDFDHWREAGTQPVDNGPSDIRLAARFVRKPYPKLLMPDAVHLATCQRLGLTLVTLDKAMAEIAATLAISVIVPD